MLKEAPSGASFFCMYKKAVTGVFGAELGVRELVGCGLLLRNCTTRGLTFGCSAAHP